MEAELVSPHKASVLHISTGFLLSCSVLFSGMGIILIVVRHSPLIGQGLSGHLAFTQETNLAVSFTAFPRETSSTQLVLNEGQAGQEVETYRHADS